MQMSLIVRTAADVLFPFIMVYGLYIIIHGHVTPGGGFQGGAILASGVLLLLLAYRYQEFTRIIRMVMMKSLESTGLLLFIIAALSAMVLGAGFFYNWLFPGGLIFGEFVPFGPGPANLNTGGVIPIMNIAVGIEVVGAIGVILLALLSGIKERI
ncbi:MAG: sodium:proton antiporter [Methanocalculus sp. MSAO_Arc2]|uniref:MnhB domain-containing protein n=1 Tax=Methanocalculus sp. MSAO_Arc2 TaxID=2293855 RepID=UPI000FEDA2FC|nr:MAG: sodium:proton antiporter [Methanocalculus sp. MSAO_Arc2]